METNIAHGCRILLSVLRVGDSDYSLLSLNKWIIVNVTGSVKMVDLSFHKVVPFFQILPKPDIEHSSDIKINVGSPMLIHSKNTFNVHLLMSDIFRDTLNYMMKHV